MRAGQYTIAMDHPATQNLPAQDQTAIRRSTRPGNLTKRSKIRDVKLQLRFSPSRSGIELRQKLLQCRFPCFVGPRPGAKNSRRLLYRARCTGSINLPLRRIRRGRPILHDNRIVGVIEPKLSHRNDVNFNAIVDPHLQCAQGQ